MIYPVRVPNMSMNRRKVMNSQNPYDRELCEKVQLAAEALKAQLAQYDRAIIDVSERFRKLLAYESQKGGKLA